MSMRTSEALAGEANGIDLTGRTVLGVVRSMVSQPARVALRSFAEGDTTILLVTVASVDLQVLTGRDGRTARSLRALVNAIGSRPGRRMELEVQGETEARS
ncbi:KH domain-containing protein [Granulicella tundricola]|uniref:Uncharacterized protein n=1 Tax=Granulicella tundricola (strain ATCC BAA-1859 / DSM 23138 / MP5ACTX9) TaxID=1198114 RepID=E8X1P5_GRATM|nr:KH domain-containing protein [Granulicella tundricola]ADW67964.1 hypothetical protein AciX9_0896 [Granulicella tundricola MP5ACTX9]